MNFRRAVCFFLTSLGFGTRRQLLRCCISASSLRIHQHGWRLGEESNSACVQLRHPFGLLTSHSVASFSLLPIASRVGPWVLTKAAQFPAMQARLHSFCSSFDCWPLPHAVVTHGDVLTALETANTEGGYRAHAPPFVLPLVADRGRGNKLSVITAFRVGAELCFLGGSAAPCLLAIQRMRGRNAAYAALEGLSMVSWYAGSPSKMFCAMYSALIDSHVISVSPARSRSISACILSTSLRASVSAKKIAGSLIFAIAFGSHFFHCSAVLFSSIFRPFPRLTVAKPSNSPLQATRRKRRPPELVRQLVRLKYFHGVTAALFRYSRPRWGCSNSPSSNVDALPMFWLGWLLLNALPCSATREGMTTFTRVVQLALAAYAGSDCQQ